MEMVEQIEEPLILGTVIAPDDYIGDMIALFLVSYIYTLLCITYFLCIIARL